MREKELRIALVCYGGVSLAVYMHGITKEIWRLAKASQHVHSSAFIASERHFTDQPKVANGASELMEKVFGEAGRHARSAVGVPVLPLGAAVEIDAIVAVKTG